MLNTKKWENLTWLAQKSDILSEYDLYDFFPRIVIVLAAFVNFLFIGQHSL